ncbi:MAG TPA: hypothetical protein VKY92_08395, partial [Verrucomicrobiae bacterium]|nr:hypothetical protein [Verrucomicrobiae bacterium]
MKSLDADPTTPGYQLSELARAAVHSADRDPARRLAWLNSICIIFLLIGIFGSRPASIRIKPLPPVEEASAVIVEPLPPPPRTLPEQQTEEPKDREPADTP